ncbi:hypothetical protein [Peribacillus tepidiphilus]|jgi:hypothetical protein|uniref:hypothetical protein n=1 Tax=Peribacillus tepidiphilus TaxID=2652445 RepID=UPI0035B516F3
MIPEENALILFKFGENKWIEKIKDGEVSFACLGRYIDIAKKTGNNEQGDIDEGVFARLRRGDSRIEEVSEQLQDDLEIISDGDYVKLRRKSSYLIPTFCFYSYRGIDLLNNEIEKPGIQRFSHYFDEKMFNGFSLDKVKNVLSSDSILSLLIIQPEPFKYLLGGELAKQGIDHVIRHINYTEFEKEEFFINPTEQRDELFYKFPKYSYQREARVCLINSPRNDLYDRLNINIGSLPDSYAILSKNKLYFELSADIVIKS